jgi:predicted secreted protein
MLQLDENANGKNIELALGQQFQICLPEIPTTGFQWSLTSDGEPTCTQLNSSYTAANTRYDGEGSHCWQFQAAQAGSANIALVYQRPWEHAATPARSFTLAVHVQA